jgi:hypothetical protein
MRDHPFVVTADFARNLERELNTVTAQRDEARDQTKQWITAFIQKSKDLGHELATVTAQRDRLAEALKKLADCDWVITLPDRMDAVRTIANEALQSLTPTTNESN